MSISVSENLSEVAITVFLSRLNYMNQFRVYFEITYYLSMELEIVNYNW
jgi:hypothetical protein